MEISNIYRSQQAGLARQLAPDFYSRDRYFYPSNVVRGLHRFSWLSNFKDIPFGQGFSFYFVKPNSFFLTWYPSIKLFCVSFFLLLLRFYRNF